MKTNVLQRLGREMPRAAFLAQYNHPFLIFGKVGGAPEDDDWNLEFDTGTVRSLDSSARTRAPDFDPKATAAFPTLTSFVSGQSNFGGVLPVLKSERNPYAGRISIGRASTCDIVVPVLHVSKLHAHFLRSDDGKWQIRDAKSTNGTFVNARRCNAGAQTPLAPGDALLFGALPARFLDAGGLFDLISSR